MTYHTCTIHTEETECACMHVHVCIKGGRESRARRYCRGPGYTPCPMQSFAWPPHCEGHVRLQDIDITSNSSNSSKTL